jgi:osmotically-inducible protein OsmY
MKPLQSLLALALALSLIVTGILSACATDGKCRTEGCAGDAQITANVKALIDQHPDLGPPNQIYVQTLHHVVYLSGEVSQGKMGQTAAAIAMQIPGVTRVDNDIAVTH